MASQPVRRSQGRKSSVMPQGLTGPPPPLTRLCPLGQPSKASWGSLKAASPSLWPGIGLGSGKKGEQEALEFAAWSQTSSTRQEWAWPVVHGWDQRRQCCSLGGSFQGPLSCNIWMGAGRVWLEVAGPYGGFDFCDPKK